MNDKKDVFVCSCGHLAIFEHDAGWRAKTWHHCTACLQPSTYWRKDEVHDHQRQEWNKS